MAVALFVLCPLTTAVSGDGDTTAAGVDSEMAEIADEYAIGTAVNQGIAPPTPVEPAQGGQPAGE